MKMFIAILLLALEGTALSDVLFSDDFNDGDDQGWTHHGSAVFTVVEEQYLIHSETMRGNGVTYSGDVSGVMSTADYAIRCRLIIDAGSAAGVGARYAGGDGWYYRLVLRPWTGVVELQRRFGDNQSFTLDTASFNVIPDTEYYVLLQVNGFEISGKVWTGSPENEPDEWLLYDQDTVQPGAGSVALFAGGYGKVRWSTAFDDVVVSTPVPQRMESLTWACIKTAL